MGLQALSCVVKSFGVFGMAYLVLLLGSRLFLHHEMQAILWPQEPAWVKIRNAGKRGAASTSVGVATLYRSCCCWRKSCLLALFLIRCFEVKKHDVRSNPSLFFVFSSLTGGAGTAACQTESVFFFCKICRKLSCLVISSWNASQYESSLNV